MRQDLHGCFAQMDRSLALPRIRARVLLQRLQTAWREAEFLKLDQALAAPELQVGWTAWWLLIPPGLGQRRKGRWASWGGEETALTAGREGVGERSLLCLCSAVKV